MMRSAVWTRCAKWSVAMFVVTLLVATMGCERRPLLDPSHTTEVQVTVDLDGLHNVTCDIYNDKITAPTVPSEMLRVLFYEPGTNRIAGESYISNLSTDSEGRRVVSGRVGILPGEYEMVVYNFDITSTLIRNDHSHSTIEAYSSPVSEALASRFNTRVDSRDEIRYQPDHVIVATDPKLVIPWHDDLHIIRTTATSVVESYYLQVKVDGLQWVSSAQAIVTGMAGSNFLGSRNRVDVPETAIYFTLEKSDDNGEAVLCSVFNTFGRIDTENELWISFDINTVDGRTESREFEISHLFESDAGRNHHWLLLDDKITIDKPTTPPTAGGGFAPELEDWTEENHEIIL